MHYNNNVLCTTIIKCTPYSHRLLKEEREIFRRNNLVMLRMLCYDSPKFEGCSTGNSSGRICSRGKKVRLTQRAPCPISQTPRLTRASVRVFHTRSADAHVYTPQKYSPSLRMHRSSMQYYGRCRCWRYGRSGSFENSCRGRAEGISCFSGKSCGTRARDTDRLREMSFAKFVEFANQHKGNLTRQNESSNTLKNLLQGKSGSCAK